jgi:hypothetical protein
MKAVIWLIGGFWLMVAGVVPAERRAGGGVAVELEKVDGGKLVATIVGIEGEDVVAVEPEGVTHRIPLEQLTEESAREVREIVFQKRIEVGPVPVEWLGRCSAEARVETSGGEDVDEVVTRGLDYLCSVQNKDGSWGEPGKGEMTGLALLCFLGHAETPLSEKYGEAVLRGVMHLVNLGIANGGALVDRDGQKSNHWVYQHAIAVRALAEAAVSFKQVQVRVPKLAEVTWMAGAIIIDNQHKSGGWDYRYAVDTGRGGDLSITGWQVLALRGCFLTGMEFDGIRGCVARALDYIGERQGESGGFGYTGTKGLGAAGYHTLTGTGMVCMQVWDRRDHVSVRLAARYLERNSKFNYETEFCDLYAAFFESMALRNRGGEAWEIYRDRMFEELCGHQLDSGAWESPGNGGKVRAVAAGYVGDGEGAELYRTCLCILILENGYRCVIKEPRL